jgi:hypothetical protein
MAGFVLCLLVPIGFSFPLEEDTLSRDEEPVIVTGNLIENFIGESVDSIFVYAYWDDHWEKVVFQIDEKNIEGSYFDEDETPGFLDGNDEIVFMANECGDRIEGSEWVEGARDDWRYEIEVTDGRPGHGDRKAWAYIYVSSVLTPKDHDYVEANNYWDFKVTSSRYIQNFLDWFPNVLEDVFILPPAGDSTDMIDRQKTRTCIIKGFPPTDEEDLQPSFSADKMKDGNVRLLTTFPAKLDQVKVTEVSTFFYEAYTEVLTTIITKLFPLNVEYIRYSVDFDSTLTGMTHYNNGGEGLLIDAIDGIDPDPPFPILPQHSWIEVNHPTAGSFIQIQDFTEAPLESINKELFYKDGGEDPSEVDTGDGVCWGEAGVLMHHVPKGLEFTVRTWTFFLPAMEGTSVGAEYASYYYYPLEIAVSPQTDIASGHLTVDTEADGNRLSWFVPGGIRDDFLVYRGYVVKWSEAELIGTVTGSPSVDTYRYLDHDRRSAGKTAYYWVALASANDSPPVMGPVSATWIARSMTTVLHQNVPNPFNPLTTIRFEVGERHGTSSMPVGIRIYNTKGELVRNLFEQEMSPGRYTVIWNGTNDKGGSVAAGVYLCRLSTPVEIASRKIILVK